MLLLRPPARLDQRRPRHPRQLSEPGRLRDRDRARPASRPRCRAVTSTAIANDLRVRVYVRASGSRAPVLDLATVSVTTPQAAFDPLRRGVHRPARAAATSTAWPLAASGGHAYQSASTWPTAFTASRYLTAHRSELRPEHGEVAGASLVHRFRRVTSGSVCWYLEVLQGATVIGTHGSAASPISCTYRQRLQDRHRLAAGDQQPGARQRRRAEALRPQHRPAAGSEHDQVELTIDYAN